MTTPVHKQLAAQQTPEQVLKDYIDYLDNPTRGAIDNLYDRLLAADSSVLRSVLTGARKRQIKRLLDDDLSELGVDDYQRAVPDPQVKVVVDTIVAHIDAVNVANKAPGAVGIDDAMVALSEYAAAHTSVVDQIMIEGQRLLDYLHRLAGTDECNNVLASTLRPRLVAIADGRPLVLRVEDRLKDAGVLR